MTYEIKKIERVDETLRVTVDYIDGEEITTVEVPIFAPATKEDILTGIKNRGLTLIAKKENITNAESIKGSVKVGDKDSIE